MTILKENIPEKEKPALQAGNSNCLHKDGKLTKCNIAQTKSNKPNKKHLEKYAVCLRLLLERPNGMNTLEANTIYRDTALHSTISDLVNKHGLTIDREFEPLPNLRGGITHYMRYWVAKCSTEKAKRLYNRCCLRCGLPPAYELEQEGVA